MYWSILKFLHWRCRDASFFVIYLKYSSIFRNTCDVLATDFTLLHLWMLSAWWKCIWRWSLLFIRLCDVLNIHSFIPSILMHLHHLLPTLNQMSTNTFEDDGSSIQWIPAGILVSKLSYQKVQFLVWYLVSDVCNYVNRIHTVHP